MITKFFKFLLRVVLTLIVVGGLVGFALAKWATAPAPAAAPAVSATPIPWGIIITAGNPVFPAVPSPTIPPAPPPPPPPPALSLAPAGQQILLGILDPCCDAASNWPVVLEIRQGLLYATEFRGEQAFEEYLAGAGIGPGVTSIIAASAGWRHQDGYWHPILTVFYEDGTGSAKSLEFNTRTMFGR